MVALPISPVTFITDTSLVHCASLHWKFGPKTKEFDTSPLDLQGYDSNMVDMLVEQNSRGPLTPVSSPGGSSGHHHHHSHHHHHTQDLSPSSSSSSSSSSAATSDSQSSPSHNAVVIKEEPGDVGALQRLQFALEKNTLFSNLYGKDSSEDLKLTKMPLGTPTDSEEEREDLLSTGNSEAGGAANIFECPLCSVTCNSRHEFNEHLVSHSQQHACPKCSFITNDEEALKGHLQDEHDIRSPDFMPDDDVSSPRINSQGKVKTFKCKQCEFKTDTKLKFWEHTKSHIRQEKMLTCPKCPFVTEYKHHLEYHLRNHFGSKPFQCNKCSYSCVNKSMLNSHLKSHSNVYQYRCADCSYATKYCHSLKLHLRKYSHSPSVVLNLDGTPNPLPIIDVYGTRRGPKIKRSDPSATSPSSQQQPASNTTTHVKSELKKRVAKSSSANIAPQPPKSVSPPVRKFTPPATSVSETDSHFYHRMPDTPITPGKNPLEMYAAALNQYILASNPLLQMVPDLAKLAKEQQSQLLSHILTSTMIAQTTPSPPLLASNSPPPSFLTSPSYNMAPEPTVLDLRKPVILPETPPREERRGAGAKRKGKAIKYEDEILDFSNNNSKKRHEQQQHEQEEEDQIKMCKYCEISFPDRVLYSMHMSYHSGDAEPFLCKSCGKRNQDKVTFFLHLTTEAH